MINHLSVSKLHSGETIHRETGMTWELSGLSSWLKCLQDPDGALEKSERTAPELFPGTKISLRLDMNPGDSKDE